MSFLRRKSIRRKGLQNLIEQETSDEISSKEKLKLQKEIKKEEERLKKEMKKEQEKQKKEEKAKQKKEKKQLEEKEKKERDFPKKKVSKKSLADFIKDGISVDVTSIEISLSTKGQDKRAENENCPPLLYLEIQNFKLRFFISINFFFSVFKNIFHYFCEKMLKNGSQY